VAADGRIYASNNRGQTFVVAAGPSFKLLATNELGERITASPAPSRGQMILRTDSMLWCLQDGRMQM
jgi:outer membrane protein assembly factor BamB